MSSLKLTLESMGGKLHTAGAFLVPVLSGSYHDMGVQYGTLMKEHMQKAYDVVVKPQVDSGVITDDVAKEWTDRALTTFSTRNKDFYAGMQKGTGWPIEKIGMLDQINEFGVFQSKIHAFAGCTSIMAWGDASSDGEMYIGRNMDWSAAFNEFAQVLTVFNPSDGGYRYANLGWPGMITLFTGINEHGVYTDLHDGTSMGSSVVFADRAPFLNALCDILSETKSLEAALRRINATHASMAMILSMADGKSAASMECAVWDNRARLPDGDSLVVTNTFFNPDWGMHKRDTVSHSIERFNNMTARLADNQGKIDAAKTRDLMDMRLFNEDGTLRQGKSAGATKPTKQDADQTTYQMVTDVSRLKVWMKVPNPKYLTDWELVDLTQFWS